MEFSSNETFLRSFHALHPGCTSQTMASATTADGFSSYEILASNIPLFSSSKEMRVLDLACGDGYLLNLLADRHQAGLELHGLDMSVAELSAAERRLKGRARLHLGRAQKLPFESASFDAVTCHMALMLMDDLDEVIAEVRRILKPGGKFSAIISDAAEIECEPSHAAFRSLLRERLRTEDLEFLRSIGDSRLTDGDSDIASIFEDGFMKPVMTKSHTFRTRESADQTLHHYLVFYGPGLLSPADRASLEWHLRESLLKFADKDGMIVRSEGLREITVLKSTP